MADLDKRYIQSLIQATLDVAHNEPQKKQIKEFSDRLNFACPICGDSHKHANKKRGNLYFNTMHYVCFNENCGRSFMGLLDTFDIRIDIQKKLDIYHYIDKNVQFNKKEDIFVIQKLDKLIDIDELTEKLIKNPESQFNSFSPVTKNSAVYQYLKFERLIDNFENIYEAEFQITPSWKENVMVTLNRSKNKILSFQIRNLKSGKKRWFKIYNFEKVYNLINPDKPLDELEALSYNKISNFYNILNVDWDQEVTVFEGYLDSIFYPNSIGAIGLNSIDDMDFLMSDDDIKLQFFFDQDRVGIKKSKLMLEKGYKVFLWQLMNKKIAANKKSISSAERALLKIKDLNNLVVVMKNTNPYDKLKLFSHFSRDKFDKIYLKEELYPKQSFF